MNRLRYDAGGIANCALGAKSVTEKTTWLVWVGGAAKRQRSPQQSVQPVRNALQGRWIFDAVGNGMDYKSSNRFF